MIYRIKIVEDGKFVRYATDKEKVWLKPKDDGSGVERMILLPAAGMFGGWQDVSDTHEVEWGDLLPTGDGKGLALYDGDIYKNTKTDIIHVYTHRGDYLNKWGKDWGKNVVIGNMNINPELLEEK